VQAPQSSRRLWARRPATTRSGTHQTRSLQILRCIRTDPLRDTCRDRCSWQHTHLTAAESAAAQALVGALEAPGLVRASAAQGLVQQLASVSVVEAWVEWDAALEAAALDAALDEVSQQQWRRLSSSSS